MADRIAWVDYARALCIILVVMMHSAVGVGAALSDTGYMHAVVAFATPFRIPAFFLIAGLFLWKTIERPWSSYLDRKVLHFVYFYVLWLTIQILFKAPGLIEDGSPASVASLYLWSFIDPFGTLWFIYLLPLFYIVTRLIRNVPTAAVLSAAAVFEISNIQTPSYVVEEFAARYIYFYLGYKFAEPIFRFAELVSRYKRRSLIAVAIWAVTNSIFVAAGVANYPFISLGLGILGTLALILVSTLLASIPAMAFLRLIGQNTIVIYLSFFLPIAITREILIRLGILDVGTTSLLVMCAGIIGPLIAFEVIKRVPVLRLNFLFERPGWARLKKENHSRQDDSLQPAK